MDVLAVAEAETRAAGLSPQDWIERLMLRAACHAESAAPAQAVGPEDEVRGGPEASEPTPHPTDD